MTRRCFTLAVGALVLLAALLLGACYTQVAAPESEPTSAPRLPERAQDITTPTPHLVSTVVLGVFSDYSVRAITETATPWPTFTLTPSHTPVPSTTPLSPTATATSTATPTMTATNTPTLTPPIPSVTYTPTDVIEPTQEVTLPPTQPADTPTPSPTRTPTATPSPSPSPTPDADHCYGTALVNLNLRDGYPLTEYDSPGSVIGSWSAGDRVIVTRWELVFFQDNPLRVDEWYAVSALDGTKNGWSAGVYNTARFIQLDATQVCLDLFGTDLPVRQGAHIIGTDEGRVFAEQFCADLDTVKLFESAMALGWLFRECNPDIWIVCRFWTDDLAIDSNFDAFVAYERIGRAFPEFCDAVEGENEKAPQNIEDWPRWVKYNSDLAYLFAARRNMQYLAASFGPGWPEVEQMDYWMPYFEWVAANPLPDGRYHGIAFHAAMFAPWYRADMQWVNNPYLAGRVYLIRDRLLIVFGFDLVKWPGVIAITEIGLSDGYSSGVWGTPYTCEELAQAYWRTDEVYILHRFPHAFHLWNIDDAGGAWTDDSACGQVIYG